MTIKPVSLSFLLILFLCAFLSCSKKSDKPTNLKGDTLPGTWEVRGMWGPLVDTYPPAFNPGNGSTWAFSNSEFKQRTKDTVYSSGTYTVDNTGLNPENNKPVQRFIFNGVAAESFELRNDSLFVYSTTTGDFQSTSVYVKISYDF